MNECVFKSHPVWVRGLKPNIRRSYKCIREVAPRVGAWIETLRRIALPPNLLRSHPVWVRGLKPLIRSVQILYYVAPRVGAWIETNQEFCLRMFSAVAPRVGAWIET